MTTDQTRLIGVIAYPAGPNPEHDLLSRWVDQVGVDASVHLFPFPVKEIADPIGALRMLGASGAYLSGRHREAGGGLVDYLTDEAHGSGVINTIVFDGDEARGHNTEARAIIDLLDPHKESFVRRSAVILGNGMMARAVAYALIRHFRIRHVAIAARDPQGAQLLKSAVVSPTIDSVVETHELFPPDIVDLLAEARLIVNATSIGGRPGSDDTPITIPDIFRPGQIIVDVVRNAEGTQLLRDASAAGATVIDGEAVFRRQLADAFTLLTGSEVDVSELLKRSE